MSTISESNFSVKSTTWSIEDALKKLRSTPCVRKNVTGTFISDKSLQKLEAAIDRAMNKPTESPSNLIALNDELNVLRQSAQQAKDSLKAATARERALSNDLEKARIELGNAQQAATSRHQAINDEKKKIQVAMDEVSLAQKKLASDKSRFDADLAIKNHEMAQSLAVERKRLESLLQAANAEKNALNVQVRALQANVQSLSVDKHELSVDLTEAHKAKTASNVKQSKPIPIQINSPTIKRALGQKGLEWLQKLDDISRDNLRERAFTMMQASTNNKNLFWKSLNALLAEIWKWIKSQSAKVVKRIKPWLDDLEADLRTGKVKAIKVYRENLEKIHADFKKEKARQADARGPHENPDFSFLENCWLYGQVAVNKLIRRPLRRLKPVQRVKVALIEFATFIKNKFTWHRAYQPVDLPTCPGDFGDDMLP